MYPGLEPPDHSRLLGTSHWGYFKLICRPKVENILRSRSKKISSRGVFLRAANSFGGVLLYGLRPRYISSGVVGGRSGSFSYLSMKSDLATLSASSFSLLAMRSAYSPAAMTSPSWGDRASKIICARKYSSGRSFAGGKEKTGLAVREMKPSPTKLRDKKGSNCIDLTREYFRYRRNVCQSMSMLSFDDSGKPDLPIFKSYF
jgi:hypothetical protein